MKRKIFSSLLLVAFLCASMGMFVSCKDYEDDINANRDDITALQNQLADLQTTLSNELSSVKSELSTQISDAKAQLQAAIDQKADQATVTALEARVATLEGELAAKEAALNAKIDAVNEAVTGLDGRLETVESTLATIVAMTGDFTALQQTVNDLKSRVEALEGLDIAAIAREAVEKDLEVQKEALEAFKQEIADADYQGQIDKLQEEIAALPTADQLKDLADKIDAYDIDNLAQRISDAEEDIAALQSSLSDYATVTSVNELKQALQKQIDDLNTTINGVSENVNTLTVFVDKMLTSIALVPDLYVDGIEAIEFHSLYYQPKALNNGVLEEAPGQAVWRDNGLAEATYRLNPSAVPLENIDSENIEFVAATAETRSVLANSPVAFNGIKSYANGLMTVNLKKTDAYQNVNKVGDDANKIYIVSLKVPRYNSDKKTTTDVYSENSRLVQTNFTPVIARLNPEADKHFDVTDRLHHYSDSATLYNSNVDNNELIAAELYYNEKHDLKEYLTGCYLNAARKHVQITKDELKAYGLALRFAIPTEPYKKDADNATDQQQFATVTADGIISSKTPAGATSNLACVGKEPIIRVMLCDTVNGKLVDARYMKIKWNQKTLDDVQLEDYVTTETLACGETTAELKWDWIIDEVYAKVHDNGLDQKTFETIYSFKNIKIEKTAPAMTNTFRAPSMLNTTNEQGDALAGTWTLTDREIGTINQTTKVKTFVAKITFVSGAPAQYPDLVMYWKFNIELPTFPTIAGYNDTYWEGGNYDYHYVYPVQYGTDAAKSIVEYNYPLEQAFAKTAKWEKADFFIKDMAECYSWDLQFAASQSINGYGVVGYTTNTEPCTENRAYMYFHGYQLYKNGTDKALQMNWPVDPNTRIPYVSWQGDADATINLYAAPNNVANQGLLNPLAQADDSKGIPVRTSGKKVNLNMWAKINPYNYVLVKNYAVCLVAPIRVNVNSKGYFEEGIAGSVQSTVKTADLAKIVDFRGYTVAEKAPSSSQFDKDAAALWKYYDVTEKTFDLSKAKFGFKVSGGSVVADDAIDYTDAMSASELSRLTSGGVNLSLSMSADGSEIIFKNNGGTNVSSKFNIFIPVTVKYAFGTITEYIKVPVYPRGQVK